MTGRRQNGSKIAGTNSANKKDNILREATKIFLIDGYDAIGLRQIGREMGLSLGAIQHYFATKDYLFESIISGLQGEFYTDIARENVANTCVSPADVLICQLTNELDDALHHRRARWLFDLWAVSRRNPTVAQHLSQSWGDWEDKVVDLLRKVRPERSTAECKTIANLILAQLEGIAVLALPSGEPRIDLEALRAACIASWRVLISA